MYLSLPPSPSTTCTTVPTRTTSLSSSEASITVAERSLSSSVRDPRLEHRLLVLGVVVLGVLRDVAELTRFLDAGGYLTPAHGRHVLELSLEAGEPFGGENDVLWHVLNTRRSRQKKARFCGESTEQLVLRGRMSIDPVSRYPATRLLNLRRSPSAPPPALANSSRACSTLSACCNADCSSRLLAASPAEPLYVPRIELAQIAVRALVAHVLDRTVEHPVELGRRSPRGVGSSLAAADELLEHPRVAERAAREQDRFGARCARTLHARAPPTAGPRRAAPAPAAPATSWAASS